MGRWGKFAASGGTGSERDQSSRPKQRSRIETNLEVRISNEFGEKK
jgi:hypothetical protein